MFSEAAFMIENPEKAKDNISLHTAGVAGALKVYEAIVKDHPKAKLTALDDIAGRQDKGELQNYVQETMKYCTKKVPWLHTRNAPKFSESLRNSSNLNIATI
jgi:hypothetical protein